MINLPHCLIPVLLLALAAPAAEPVDLGGGVALLRPPSLAAEPPPAEGPVILDLRYLPAPSGSSLQAWRSVLRAPGPLRIVIYDADPPEAMEVLLAERHPNVLTMAPAGTRPLPDIAVEVDPAADRAAYDALESGTNIEALTMDAREKRRYDEAALLRAHLRSGARFRDPSPPGPKAEEEKEGEEPAPPADLLLRRAILLARGLQALGRG